MANFRGYLKTHGRIIAYTLVAALVLAWLALYRLGSLTGGLSHGEIQTAGAAVGWHGAYHAPLNLPLQLVRSVVFKLAPQHAAFLTRLPNALFGDLAIISFGCLIRLWHGGRTAILASLLFAFSAWTLHASRLASFDVMYLWAMPTLVLVQLLIMQRYDQPVIWYGSLLIWGLLLYIPGLIWLIGLSLWWQRRALVSGWQHFKMPWQRLLSILAVLIWLPLLIIDLSRHGQLKLWLGLPQHLASATELIKQFGLVFSHLLVRGPVSPDIWLNKAPILDVFSLVMCGLGLYFYIRHWQSKRSRLLGEFVLASAILIALQGPVGLSLLVPVLFMLAATGIAYLIKEWLNVFPANPLARSFGIGLVSLAVLVSCIYNYRAYFVAWPHNSATVSTFRYQPKKGLNT